MLKSLREKKNECQKRYWKRKFDKMTLEEKVLHKETMYGYQKVIRAKIKDIYGFGSGMLWRYGLKILIPIYKKYNNCCANCYKKTDLTIHHIDGKGRNYINKGLKPNNKLINLILICRSCHGKIDGRKSKGKSKGNNKNKGSWKSRSEQSKKNSLVNLLLSRKRKGE
jgi:hypothetical protein